MPETIEFLQIVVQPAHVCGDAFGSLGLFNVIKNKAGVIMFATGAEPDKGGAEKWTTEVKDVALDDYQRLAEKIADQTEEVITNRKADDHPLDYQIIYFLNGNPLGKKISLRIECVMSATRPEKSFELYEEVAAFLNTYAMNA